MNNNYLAHDGVKGQHWGVHYQGKWQNHARYAIGDWRHSDGTKGNKSNTKYGGTSSANVRDTALGLERDIDVRYEDAKKAAQVTGKKAINQGRKDAKSDFDLQMIDRGSKSTAYKWSANKSTAATLLLNSVFGDAINLYSTHKKYSAYKTRHGKGQQDNIKEILQLGNRQRRINTLNKNFDTRISKNAIKKLNLSKDYVDAYSKRMDELLSNNKNVKKINKLNEKNYKLSVSDKTFFNELNELIGGPGNLTKSSIIYNHIITPAAVATAASVGAIALLNAAGVKQIASVNIVNVPQIFGTSDLLRAAGSKVVRA